MLDRVHHRFHPWPAEALVSVASRFLVDLPLVEQPVREAIASHMAFAHQAVTAASKQ
jgi:dynein heavy chain